MGLSVIHDDDGFTLCRSLGQDHAIRSGSPRPEDGSEWARVPWRAVTGYELVDPWPSARLYVGDRDSEGEARTRLYELHPHKVHRIFSFDPERYQEEAFAAVVAGLGAELRRRRELGSRGWLEAPDVPWEQVPAFPVFEGPRDVGAFRTAPERSPVVARRGRPSPFEAMLTWLASSPTKRWRETAREVLVTHEHVYAENWDDRVYRVPTEALRTRLAHDDESDAVYIFGRRTFLVLPHRRGCEVMALLDRRLRDRVRGRR